MKLQRTQETFRCLQKSGFMVYIMQFNAYKHTNIQVCMHAQIHLISMGLAQAYPIILEEVDDIFILEGLDNVIVLEAYTGRNAF